MAIEARPTVYDGIEMRSRTEALFAAFLDRAGLVWKYEPQAFGSSTGQYLPDFWISRGAQGDLYVEIKGDLLTTGWRRLVGRVETIWTSEPRAAIAIIVASALSTNGFRFAFSEGWLPYSRLWDREARFAVCSVCRKVSIATSIADWAVDCHICNDFTPPLMYLNPLEWRPT